MQSILDTGRDMLAQAGLNVSTHLESGEPIDVIADMASRLKVDLLIVGHSRHKPFAMRWWRGSVDTLLSDKIRCTLMIAREQQF
jgi:nucleotide-binding universal stress UspA family protein